MSTLYEMTQQAKILYEMLQAEELDEQTFADTLEAMGTQEKVEGYCQIIKQLQADAEMFEAEETRLAARKKTIKNSIEKMRDTLLMFLQQSGQEKVKAGTFSVSIASTKKVNILDETKIPPEYLIEQPAKVNKTDIKKALQEGEKINGAELVTNFGVRIR